MKAWKRRAAIVAGGLAVVSIAAALVLNALNSNIALYVTPSEVAAGKAPHNAAFRIGGLVKNGSLRRDNLTVHFIVTDTVREIPVEYTGILPDLFRDNQSVIATGHMENAHFVATEVLAKHDETYMPKELKDAMAKAHEGKKVAENEAAGGAR